MKASATRPEIQGLRALAVVLVVAYHLWPQRLTGGFVGVDVFFVVSGYLIIGHLGREIDQRGTVRLGRFWARRARRLLPSSLLVIATTAAVVYLVVPATLWRQYLTELLASTLYLENWQLARSATDYLGSQEAPSPAQHYWSLSVEEQFYIAWPIILVIISAIAARAGANRLRAVVIVLGVIGAASLVHSVIATATVPAAAYFATTTRAWEFAAGGLLAVAVPAARALAPRLGTAAQYVGIALIVAAALLFDGETPFPGASAAVPVVGTLLIIWAGEPAATLAPGRLARWRPVRFLGDISYALYLWHWPVIVLAPYLLDRPLGTLDKVAALTLALLLATATTYLLENPVRFSRPATWTSLRTFVAATAATLLVASISVAGLGTMAVAQQRSDALTTQLTDEGGVDCFGAAALAPGAPIPCENDELAGVLLPDLATLANDNSTGPDCFESQPGDTVGGCTAGSARPDALKVALVGDSHAGVFAPGLRDRLEELNWSLDIFTGWDCAWRAIVDPAHDGLCSERRSALQSAFETGRYDIVITTAWRNIDQGDPAVDQRWKAYSSAWAPVIAAGTRVIVIGDNPNVPQAAMDCLAEQDVDSLLAGACDFMAAEGESTIDPLVRAAAETPGVEFIDTSRYFCADGECPMVTGNVIVYRDGHHLSNTYARTLVPFVLDQIGAGAP